jgi:hypothetical protein
VWNKILWVDIQLDCPHQIYHGPKEMLMVPWVQSERVWFWKIWSKILHSECHAFELKIRPQIFINYIQHFCLARLVPLQHWAMSSLFHVDYNIIISNQFVGFLYLIHALKAIKIWFGTTTECPKWSGSEKIGHHVDLCVNERPIFKNKSASYPWTNNSCMA